MRIVMIEDEARIASFVKSGLESEGFLGSTPTTAPLAWSWSSTRIRTSSSWT